jgi:soluble lytic murein transglycosylase-like protein
MGVPRTGGAGRSISLWFIVAMWAVLLGLDPRSVWAALDDLARQGQWARVLEVASRRGEQLPLNAAEAMIAAHAARVLGDRPAEIRFLRLAAAGDTTPFAELAAVQLAAVLEADDPASAVDLALPSFGRGRPWPLRESAAETVAGVVSTGLQGPYRTAVEGDVSSLAAGLRRRVELALALTDPTNRRQRLERLLAGETGDLVALEAAEALAGSDSLTPVERWRVATAFFNHALYEQAARMLDGLETGRHSGVPADQVLFTRGRCAFRAARWTEAVGWYQKALTQASSADRRADFEVHIGRAFELAGDLDAAVTAAVAAVRLHPTDYRRLFLARLRLRRGETELAAQGVGQLRGRTARAQGGVLLALDAMRRGDHEAAFALWNRVRRRPWSEPAAVAAARLAAAAGDRAAVLDLLEREAPGFDPFWGEQARSVMATLPDEQLAEWRDRCRRSVENSQGRSRWRALGLWADLEPDQRQLDVIRKRVAGEIGIDGEFSPNWFRPGLAADLWRIGLESEAGRWDPTGFPNGDVSQSAWTALRFAEMGMPWSAIRMADGAWRQAGSEVPIRAFPQEFQRTAYPLPYTAQVTTAAEAAGVDWSLLAAVAREESRWNPEAFSAVGARGLLQLMPATAQVVAGRLGVPPPRPMELFDPAISLKLGAAELARLVAVFDGRHAPAIAAYNAGEQQAKLWLEQCGAGCTDELYVVNISFAATRSYTATVLTGASMYRDLYGGTGGKKQAPP